MHTLLLHTLAPRPSPLAPLSCTLLHAHAHARYLPVNREATNKEGYLKRFRELAGALADKSNPTLKERLLSGKIKAGHFVRMTSDEMASDEAPLVFVFLLMYYDCLHMF